LKRNLNILQPLVENAISHGLFHKKTGGILKLKFYLGKTSEELICIIEDNGIGRERAKEIRKSSTAQYESYGTKLTTQLIDIFKEYEHMNIYLEYIDKESPESGTIVKLTIKNVKYVA
jgi:sensor histidine kinase YesM